MTMVVLNMSEPIKIVLIALVLLLAGVGFIVTMEQLSGQNVKLTQQEKPPASMTLLVVDNEIWLRLLDIDGYSTKAPGNVQVQLAEVKNNDGGGFTYSHILSNAAQINHFDMIYVSNRGNATNIYAATTEINLPSGKGIYSIKATYYPRGEDYSLSAEIIRGT
jgi:hypothetical protein